MTSIYKPIRDFIQLVDERNKDLAVKRNLGLSISKEFIPTVGNTVGANMANYKIVRKNQFACSLMQVRRDKKMPVALLRQFDQVIISQAYPVFKVIDEEVLLPEYLMMWFSREEFDRHACFLAVGGVRGSLEWEDFLEMELPVPSIEKQRAIVKEYQTVTDRIKLNEQLKQKLEETAQAIYRHWFVDFEFPNEEGLPYKSSGGDMVYNEELDQEIPEGWGAKKLEEISSLKYGKMLSSSKFLSEGYPVYSGYGIRGYYSEFMYENPEILVLCRGVSGTGEVRMSPAKAFITNLSIVVEITDLEMNKQFLFYFLKNQNLRSLDSGSAQSQITIGDLNNVLILNPNYVTQSIFGEYNNAIKTHSINNNDEIKALISFKEVLLSRLAIKESLQTSQAI
ncbi:MAG TPA: hypothetical protein DCS15_03555 [Flavobacteriales bacterium]|nr:hypothetical protein [Flavobacteriales bacterium]